MRTDVMLKVLPLLLEAAVTTLYVSLAAMAMGLALGILVCVLRVSPWAPFSLGAGLFISFFRGVPPLVQLLLGYVLLPEIGFNPPVTILAILVLGVGSAAYVAEIYRGALSTVGRGQREAAVALGFSKAAIWRRIMIPQSTRIAMPSLVNELILLLKGSALLSVVGVTELTRVGQTSAAATYRPLEVFLMTAAIYLLLNVCLATIGGLIERRLSPG